MDLHLQATNPMSQESDTETEAPQKVQTHLTKALSLSATNNGSLKPHHHRPTPPHAVAAAAAATASYKECLKNHAAKLGGLALDGCGEFMPSSTATLHDPSSLRCAACGCHRNFHRRDPTTLPLLVPLNWAPSPSSGPSTGATSPTTTNTTSPTPLDHSSPYHHTTNYPSGVHMLMGLSHLEQKSPCQPGLKRARTKFTQEQKLKMQAFAEKLGWKMLRGSDDKMVQEFCNEVGVKRNVFKVWMHNNKHRNEKCSTNYTVNVNTSINTSGDERLEVPS